jgi:hypothetical protein
MVAAIDIFDFIGNKIFKSTNFSRKVYQEKFIKNETAKKKESLHCRDSQVEDPIGWQGLYGTGVYGKGYYFWILV